MTVTEERREEHFLTKADALARIGKHRGKIRAHISVKLPVDDLNYYEGRTWVRLTRDAALLMVKDMINERLEEKGARVKLTFYGDRRPTLWIG